MNRVDKKTLQGGFTIIELLLAMTFVSVLLLAIAVMVIQIGTVYNKGITMRAVDQAGRLVSADVQQSLGQSQPLMLESAYVLQRAPGSSNSDQPEGGRLCTGSYTYIWNFGVALSEQRYRPINKFVDSDQEIRMVRIRDAGGQYCSNLTAPIESARATEILAAGDRNLALHEFTIRELARDTALGQALYGVTMKIGTNDQSALTTIDASCKPPSDDEAMQEYCAVNMFDFTAQAGNKGVQ